MLFCICLSIYCHFKNSVHTLIVYTHICSGRCRTVPLTRSPTLPRTVIPTAYQTVIQMAITVLHITVNITVNITARTAGMVGVRRTDSRTSTRPPTANISHTKVTSTTLAFSIQNKNQQKKNSNMFLKPILFQCATP